jgi:hypothetical protein
MVGPPPFPGLSGYSAASRCAVALGQHVFDQAHLAFQIVDGDVEFGRAGAPCRHRRSRAISSVRVKLLRGLLVADIIQVQQLADFLEAESRSACRAGSASAAPGRGV